jgi:copper chaperone CopZ
MKILKIFITSLVRFVFGFTTSAQTHNPAMNMKMVNTKTETFKVLGNCEMCKARIEKAVKEEGATKADWNQETKLLKVTFIPSKTSIDAFTKKLAAVGHDTEKLKAEDNVYDSLPACCKYERTSIKVDVDYTCPMHSDIHNDKPAKCPKCGMVLEKNEITKPEASKSMHSMEDMHKNCT